MALAIDTSASSMPRELWLAFVAARAWDGEQAPELEQKLAKPAKDPTRCTSSPWGHRVPGVSP